MHVVWTDEALADYHQNIDFLLKEWTDQVALDFIEDVDAVISLIVSRPELFPLTDYRGIRKAVVRKQITLFYKISDNSIQLIRFWNNYQDPSRLKL
ncbi:MAG: type II toxin-antitoxin system RelE/ParE family toxin [Cyclobacteriaceae bacterium]|nr:type II toxin-antitoxin system RelE/ParE family toxin [Cyclobacteriaceae bacterium]